VSERIQRIRAAIEKNENCLARHCGSVPVKEIFEGKTVWEGVVEVFDLLRHPRAIRCYAWSFIENGEPQYTTVLEIPPVDSPESAVKVAIASKAR
jgi:hypothetical protein